MVSDRIAARAEAELSKRYPGARFMETGLDAFSWHSALRPAWFKELMSVAVPSIGCTYAGYLPAMWLVPVMGICVYTARTRNAQ